MLALEKQPKAGRGTAVQRPGELSFEDPQEAWLCAICGLLISGPKHAFSMRAGGPTQVFPNPLGQMQVIVTVREAMHWEPLGRPTAEYTWFDGYTWQAIVCQGCRAHVGWCYRAELGVTPSAFFGLLAASLKAG